MIVDVHKQMIKGCATLPLISGLKPVYEFGDSHHLNMILKYYNDSLEPIYPLIYNVEMESDQDRNRGYAIADLKLIIATRNDHTEFKNTQRWATSYQNILFPMVMNIETLFAKSGLFIWDGTFNLKEFPNYGDGQENETTDIWDAVRFDTNIKITNNCVGSFKY